MAAIAPEGSIFVSFQLKFLQELSAVDELFRKVASWPLKLPQANCHRAGVVRRNKLKLEILFGSKIQLARSGA